MRGKMDVPGVPDPKRVHPLPPLPLDVPSAGAPTGVRRAPGQPAIGRRALPPRGEPRRETVLPAGAVAPAAPQVRAPRLHEAKAENPAADVRELAQTRGLPAALRLRPRRPPAAPLLRLADAPVVRKRGQLKDSITFGRAAANRIILR